MQGPAMKSTVARACVRRAACGLLACVVLLAGCASQPDQARSLRPAVPELQLLDAGVLEIPRGCEPARGKVYRTSFTVQADGRVAAVVSDSGPGCVQDALRRWVATFRYRPVAEPLAATLDWLDVTAPRGS
jgi:hypothetical protein